MNEIKTNPETKMLVYSADAINNILGIIDKTFSVSGINQIMSVSAIVNELTHPFKEMELKEFLTKLNLTKLKKIKILSLKSIRNIIS